MFKLEDISWLKEGMRNGTLVWCADGSYKRKVVPLVLSVGWVVECMACEKRMKESFYEESESVNSYQAKQLGFCAICHLLAVLSFFNQIQFQKLKVGCNNYGTIKISRHRITRI